MTDKPFLYTLDQNKAPKSFATFEAMERDAKRAVRRGWPPLTLYHECTQLGIVTRTGEGLIVTDLYPEGTMFA